MKLLIAAQVVDETDPLLGFFTRWIQEFAERTEHVTVIGLGVGKYALPKNVSVYSLGKESGKKSAIAYAIRFKYYAWKYRHEYDTVFVHQNEEYILIAGLMWRLLGKKVYLWRNHYAGSWKTYIAARIATGVFCTSRYSYTAKFKNTRLMPVGVDTQEFYPSLEVERPPRSILFLARMTPSKHAEVLIDALVLLQKRNIPFTASFVGSPILGGEAYYKSVLERAAPLGNHVSFTPGVPKSEALALFQSHEIFVNCSPSGMFDKTLFEAGITGALVVASSADYADLAGPGLSFTEGSAESLAITLQNLLNMDHASKDSIAKSCEDVARAQGLSVLMESLERAILKPK